MILCVIQYVQIGQEVNYMAGRSYTIHISSSEEQPTKDMEFDEQNYDDDSPGERFAAYFVIGLFAVIIAGLVSYLIAITVFDFKNGAASSDSVVTISAKAFANFSYDKIASYMPAAIRRSGFITDSDEFAEFRTQAVNNGYSFKRLIIDNESNVSDITSLEKGLYTTYSKNIKISSAKLVRVTVLFSDENAQEVQCKFNIIPIKVGQKWYLYTGSPVTINDAMINLFDSMISASDTVSIEKEITYVPEKTDPVSVPETKLDFYKGARADLLSGACMIAGVKHTMPDALSSFNKLFTIGDSYNKTILKPDETINGVKADFIDTQYDSLSLYVSVANLKDDIQFVNDGSVTTLYIGQDETKMPDVVLPGGITFGSSYFNFIKMYGKSVPVKGDSIYRGTLSDSVYEIPLKNEHNRIYFGFKNDVLTEIQWHYIDMTDYRGI